MADYDPNSGISTGRAAVLLGGAVLFAGGLLAVWFFTDSQSSETYRDAQNRVLKIVPGQSIDVQGDEAAKPRRSVEDILAASRSNRATPASRPATAPTTGPAAAPADEPSLYELLHPRATPTTRPTPIEPAPPLSAHPD